MLQQPDGFSAGHRISTLLKSELIVENAILNMPPEGRDLNIRALHPRSVDWLETMECSTLGAEKEGVHVDSANLTK